MTPSLIWNKMCKKKINKKHEQNLLLAFYNLKQEFEIIEQNILLDSLLSADSFVYWNMNSRWKYFLDSFQRNYFLVIQMTIVQTGEVWTGVNLIENITPNHCKHDHQCKSLGMSEILTTRWRLQYSITVKLNLLPILYLFLCSSMFFPILQIYDIDKRIILKIWVALTNTFKTYL